MHQLNANIRKGRDWVPLPLPSPLLLRLPIQHTIGLPTNFRFYCIHPASHAWQY